jgi:hypothetical protein
MENTLLGRCCAAYDEASEHGVERDAVIALFQHLAAELIYEEHHRGHLTGHDVCRLLIVHAAGGGNG